MVGEGCAVRARWDSGYLLLRFDVRAGKARRPKFPEDGPGLTLWGECGDKHRELFSIRFEWVIRDAIRDGVRCATFVGQNTVLGTLKDTKDRPEIEAWRARGRDLALKAALSGYPDVALGDLDLQSGAWVPSSEVVLQRLLTLAVIKANCVRDARPVIEGRPLFGLHYP
jgi:hypothetical protein